MAVTAEGVFRIIDRASMPMEKMRMQAERTDRSFRKLALTMDAVGNRDQVRQMDQVNRKTNDYNSTLGRTENVMRKVRGETRQNETATTRWSNAVKRLHGDFSKFMVLVKFMKFPLIGAGIGMIVQAVGALAGGIVALLPKIADLSGAVAPAIAGFTGLALTAVTVKLAFGGMTKAMQGDKAALKALTPEARRFVTTLKMYSPVMKELKESAQKGLFPGLDYSIRRLQRGVPVLKELLGVYGARIGGLATFFSTKMTTPGALKGFRQIGMQGAEMLTDMGHSLFYVGKMLGNVAIAARPFTSWMSKGIMNWLQYKAALAQANRENGRLAQFFARSRESLTMFGHILHNLWITFRNVGHASRQLGDELWGSAEKATKGWADFTGSIAGQSKLTAWFNGLYTNINPIFGLVGDLSKAILRMGSDPTMAKMVNGLRGLVPMLEKALTMLTRAFGPAAVAFLSELMKTLGYLVGESGPLTIFLKALTSVLKIFNNLVSVVPGLGKVLTAAFSMLLISRFTGSIILLTRSMFGLATAEKAVAASSIAGGGGKVGKTLLGFTAISSLGGRGAAALKGGGAAAGAGQLVLPGMAAAGAGRLAGLAGLGGRAGAVLGAAGKFAWPLAALGGIYGMATAPREGSALDQVGQTIQGGFHMASGGLIPQAETKSMVASKFNTSMLQDVSKNLGYDKRGSGALFTQGGGGHAKNLKQYTAETLKIKAALGQVRKINAAIGWTDTQAAYDTVKALQAELKLRHGIIKVGKQGKTQADVNAARKGINQLADVYAVVMPKKGRAAALARVREFAADMMKKLGPAGKKEMGESLLKGYGDLTKKHPELKKQFEGLRKDIGRSFKGTAENIQTVNGRILTGTTKEWQNIQKAMTVPAERVKQELNTKFTAIQNMAVGSLQAMGYTAKQARAYVQGSDATGNLPTTTGPKLPHNYKARGGRLQGRGLQDSIPLGGGTLAAPGELVINRHTEQRINGLLGGRTTLGREVADETKPHSAPRSGIMAGLATGGRVGFGAMMSEAQQINAAHYPYKWGGGHDAGFTPPYDCSGAVSAVLHAGGALASPRTSGSLMNYGEPGAGAVTLFASPKHVYMRLGSSYFGTSTSNPGGGAGFFAGSPRAGFAVRHVGGGGAEMGPLGIPGTALSGIPGAFSTASQKQFARGLRKGVNSRLAKGGRIPFGGWFGEGGAMHAKRPMLIGVGDKGGEDVVVKPHKRGGGGGRFAHVSFGDIIIKISDANAVAVQVEAQVMKALDEISRKLDTMSLEEATID